MDSRPSPPEVAKRVIAAFGGLTKMHRKLTEAGEPVPIGTIHSWGKSANGIPRWHRRSILDVAKRKEIPLPVEFVEGEAA